jgi:Family of unknown function (DUF6464)
MKFKHQISIKLKKITFKIILAGLFFITIGLLCWKSPWIRSLTMMVFTVIVAGIVGGTVGAIAGSAFVFVLIVCARTILRIQRFRAKIIDAWRDDRIDSMPAYPINDRSIRAQLAAISRLSPSERLARITELENLIRLRSSVFSIADLQNLNLLGRERQRIVEERSWSYARRLRVDRIEEIRNSRLANGRTLPSGLADIDDDLESINFDDDENPFLSGLTYYGDDDLDGIGDLTCTYNARSLFLRCAVHPDVETCEGCRDYQSSIDS